MSLKLLWVSESEMVSCGGWLMMELPWPADAGVRSLHCSHWSQVLSQCWAAPLTGHRSTPVSEHETWATPAWAQVLNIPPLTSADLQTLPDCQYKYLKRYQQESDVICCQPSVEMRQWEWTNKEVNWLNRMSTVESLILQYWKNLMLKNYISLLCHH